MSERYQKYLYNATKSVPKTSRYRVNKCRSKNYDDSDEDKIWQDCSNQESDNIDSSENDRMSISTTSSLHSEYKIENCNQFNASSPEITSEHNSAHNQDQVFEVQNKSSSPMSIASVPAIFNNSDNSNPEMQNVEWLRELDEDFHNLSTNDDSDYESDEDNNFRVCKDEKQNVPNNRLQDLLEKDNIDDSIDCSLAVSKPEMLFAILKYSLTYNLSQSAMADLCKMVNSFFVSSILPDTRYLIDQLFNRPEDVEYHAICPSCKKYIKSFDRKDKSIICFSCNAKTFLKDPTYSEFFAIINIENELVNLIESNSDHYIKISEERMDNKINCNDFEDGILYKKLLSSLPDSEKKNFVTSTFNSDGSPVFESSKFSIWPIQMIINELPYQTRTSNPVICGIWFGKNKPDMDIFLKPFIKKMNKLADEGIDCTIGNEQRQIKVFAVCCCVDSQARAPMQGIVQYNGYFGCSWCLHPGVYVNTEKGGSIKYILRNVATKKRTKEQTLKVMEQVKPGNPMNGIKRKSELASLNKYDIISGFVPDGMHCVNLGIAEQFAQYWLECNNTPYSLSNDDINTIDYLIQNIKVPNQVVRLSRSIRDRKFWKAREWENWVLYYSIPILLCFPHFHRYVMHWALLVEAYYLLLKSSITRDELIHADTLLKMFVAETEILYGKRAMTYNVHQLLHIVQSVVDWGPLWAHSGYCFESGNGNIVKKIQGAKGVVHQICRIISMKQNELVLKRHIETLENSKIQNFIDYMDKRLVKKSIKINDIRYFGVERPLKEKWIQKFSLSNETVAYNKVVKEGCLYTSSVKERIRSNNSYAYTKDNCFIEIKAFVIDPTNKKELILCKILNTQSALNTNSLWLEEILNISDNVVAIETKNIDKICVYVETEEKKYICAVPHLFYY